MITFLDDDIANGLTLSDWQDKPTTTTPGQRERAAFVYGTPTSALRMGVWQCTEGRFNVTRTTTEICRLLSGDVTLHGADGQTQILNAGDTFVLPAGWSGEWEIRETAKKIFIVHDMAATD